MGEPQPRASELCALVATILNAGMPALLPAPLNTQFAAEYNPSPYYDLKLLNTLKVDVAPTGLKRPRFTRKARSYEWQIDVVMQKQCRDIESQTALVNMADDALNLLLDQRLRERSDVLILDGELFDDDLYDMAMKLQNNLFWTGCRVQLMWYP